MSEERKYKNTEEQLKQKLENLKQILTILESDMENYEKIIELSRIYSTPEKFRSTYQLIYNQGQEDPMFKDCIGRFIDIYNFYLACQQNGLLDNARYVLSIEGYLEYYEKAEPVIKKYIEDTESYKTSEFLINLSISEDLFKRYVKTVENINPILYQEYLNKLEENKKVRFYANKESINSLATAINTGILENGEEFNLLEFLKRIPFLRSKNFVEKLIEFMKRNNTKEEFDTIMKYMSQNRLFDKNLPNTLNIKRLYDEKTIVNGREITKEDNDIILEYMKKNRYPMIRKVYILIRKEYLNGNILPLEKDKVKENSLD